MRRLDDLENGLFLYQDPSLFCFGMDAVLLAAFEAVRPGDRVMDLCCGNGIVPHLMYARAAARGNAASFTGLELLPQSVELARASVARNGLFGKITIDEGDVREAAARYAAASFTMVTCNPPYRRAGSGLPAGSDAKEMARSETRLTFADAAKAASHLLPHGGRFVLVHRPARLAEILATLREVHLEPKRLRLVHPMAGKEANLFLLVARKGGGQELSVEPPLVVYEEPGRYTEEVLGIYGKGTKEGVPKAAGRTDI